MSYKIAQIKYDENGNYLLNTLTNKSKGQNLPAQLKTDLFLNETTYQYGSGLKFNNNQTYFEQGVKYYCKIIVNSALTINEGLNVILTSTDNKNIYANTSPMQFLFKDVYFLRGDQNDIIQFIFVPNTNSYNSIIFQNLGPDWKNFLKNIQIQTDTESNNESESNENNSNESWETIKNEWQEIVDKWDCEVSQIKNLLTEKQVTEIFKFGIQGSPGLIFCINGEELRISPNGIYEIKNNYLINFIGIIKKPNDNKKFIIDYLY